MSTNWLVVWNGHLWVVVAKSYDFYDFHAKLLGPIITRFVCTYMTGNLTNESGIIVSTNGKIICG